MSVTRRSLSLLALGGSLPMPAWAQAGATLAVSQVSETRDLASIDPMRSLDFTIPSSLIFDTLLERGGQKHLVPALDAVGAHCPHHLALHAP